VGRTEEPFHSREWWGPGRAPYQVAEALPAGRRGSLPTRFPSPAEASGAAGRRPSRLAGARLLRRRPLGCRLLGSSLLGRSLLAFPLGGRPLLGGLVFQHGGADDLLDGLDAVHACGLAVVGL